MSEKSTEVLKQQVRQYWNSRACGTFLTDKEKYTREYFEEIEQQRYKLQPEIFSFAQFTRFHGKKLLEVGTGAGTDFQQWVRAGTQAFGLDLTEEAAEHVRNRLRLYGLAAQEIRVGDCESLPYPDNTFDIVYSWGVIHHTPNTEKALHEIIRVCKTGGVCKVMIYHRHSLLAYFFWLRHGLLRGRPWLTVNRVLNKYMESAGTKAFTKGEVRRMIAGMPVDNIEIKAILSYYDLLKRFNPVVRLIARVIATILGGNRVGWFLTIQFRKSESS